MRTPRSHSPTIPLSVSVRRSRWAIPAGLIALGVLPAVMGILRLVEVAKHTVTPANARFLAAPLPVTVHVLSVVPFAILGALQLAPPDPQGRGRSRWHRIVGWLLVPCGFAAALSGLWMSVFYPWPAGDGVGVFVERIVFGSAMAASMVLAVDAIRRRDFVAHGAWMIRAYAIGIGAGTQVLTHLPWFLLVDQPPGEGPRTVMMGAAWVINLLVAEWAIRRAATRGQTGRARAARPLPHFAGKVSSTG
ncbi:MAG: DUF2306 domain-containing protein [Deltaproteobacteria bacterium]|nr:DUF2306 domain-containing protein [Deltaproteobacteria bacterium]